jgi:asparagine synthase (glutamine-hydrolysing)
MKIPGRQQKALMRRALEPVLPPYVLARPKQGFCAPVGSWVSSILAARRLPKAASLFDTGILDRAAVESIRHGEKNSFAGWTSTILAEWVERNVHTATTQERPPAEVTA